MSKSFQLFICFLIFCSAAASRKTFRNHFKAVAEQSYNSSNSSIRPNGQNSNNSNSSNSSNASLLNCFVKPNVNMLALELANSLNQSSNATKTIRDFAINLAQNYLQNHVACLESHGWDKLFLTLLKPVLFRDGFG